MPSSPLIIDPNATVSGSTFEQYRRLLCDEVGQLAICTVTTLLSTQTQAEADRWVVLEAVQSDQVPTDSLDGFYVYVVNGDQGGQARRVVSGQFRGESGAALLDRPFAAPLERGTEVELTDVLPAVRLSTTQGVRDVLNRVLDMLTVIHDVPCTADGTRRISMVGYPWPLKGVREVYQPDTAADAVLRPIGQGWSFEPDAEAPYVQLDGALADGTPVTVSVNRPAKTWIKTHGTWGDSDTGLVDNTDAALYDERTVVSMAKPICLRAMAGLHARGSKEREAYLSEAAMLETRAAAARFYGGFRGSSAQRVLAAGRR